MDAELNALRSSVERLRRLVVPLDDAQIDAPAYPSEWTIADVLSHVGSSAVIQQRRLDDALADAVTPDELAPATWDTWNAKGARAKVEDGLAADAALVERIEQLSETERAAVRVSMGPMEFDATGLVGLRLNEHALHTWDVEVALDPAAVIPPDAVEIVVDHLDLIARYTARPTGASRAINVHTSSPARAFRVELRADGVTVTTALDPGDGDLVELPAEAWIRLVYGRLDADHASGITADAAVLDELRVVFPGP